MSSLAGKFKQLKLYLKALPEALPLVDIADQDAKEWVQDIKVALQQFLPRNDAGIFYITQQGKWIKELATVLKYSVTKLPGSTILQSWLKSSIDSTEKCILKYGGKVSFPSDHQFHSSQTSKSMMHLDHQGQHCLRMCCQTTLNGSAVASFHKSICKDHKKPDTKALHNIEDSDYITDDESNNGCKGGKKIFPLLLRISRPCHAIADPQKKMAQCIASKGSKMEGGALVQAAVEELARKQPSLLDQLDKKMGIEKKCTHEDLSGAGMEAPPLTCSRTEPLVGHLSKFPESSGQMKLTLISSTTLKGGRHSRKRQKKALIEFIVCCGIPPHIIQHQKFKNLMNVLNGNYIPLSHTTFEDSLKCRDMTLTLDGGKLGKKKFFSMHSFCMELDDVDRLSQMGEYICDLLYKTFWCSMGVSTYTLDWFDVACKDLHIQCGLHSVGETRFGTIYWSLNSVVQGIPVFTKIICNPGLGIDNAMLHTLFDNNEDVFAFQRDLKWLGAVLMPFACAIQCLEAKDTNPANMYAYWLAIVAHLQDLLTKDDSLKEKLKYAIELKEKIHAIANSWFVQLIENEQASNIYLTAFVLDPENQAAPILTNPNPLAIPSVTITREKGKPTIRSRPEIIDGIGLILLKLLQNEYGDEYCAGHSVEEARSVMEDINPHLAKWNPCKALHALKAQFRAYLAGVKPFNHRHGQNESIHDYWSWLLDNEDSDVLAALTVKIFSAMPVSMVNEHAICDESEIPAHVDPEADPLKWLDDGFPDLSGFKHHYFDLAAEFDISRYIQILADSISNGTTTHSGNMQQSSGSGNSFGNKEAGDFIQPDGDWGQWS
ncbi:hypothetical protein F5148DRAFT_1277633 [Russula earlei]|uniref:Uncharacterized protein n=1 Tax=Russula earlei TaxID=71964 RepID=A0ACC0TXF0_9AGAM|nr:hypothetical protein F5148DRAFT_1277633 [Russula earlei]